MSVYVLFVMNHTHDMTESKPKLNTFNDSENLNNKKNKYTISQDIVLRIVKHCVEDEIEGQ